MYVFYDLEHQRWHTNNVLVIEQNTNFPQTAQQEEVNSQAVKVSLHSAYEDRQHWPRSLWDCNPVFCLHSVVDMNKH